MGGVPLTISFTFSSIIFFAMILLETRSKQVAENSKKTIFFREIYFVFLESSEMHADPGLKEIRAKLYPNFSLKNL